MLPYTLTYATSYANLQVVAMLFYSVGAMLGALTIYRFYIIASVDHKLHNSTVSKVLSLLAFRVQKYKY